jgi:hypothetical protein
MEGQARHTAKSLPQCGQVAHYFLAVPALVQSMNRRMIPKRQLRGGKSTLFELYLPMPHRCKQYSCPTQDEPERGS